MTPGEDVTVMMGKWLKIEKIPGNHHVQNQVGYIFSGFLSREDAKEVAEYFGMTLDD